MPMKMMMERAAKAIQQTGRISHLKRKMKRFPLKRGTYILSNFVMITVRRVKGHKVVHMRYVAKDARRLR